MRDGKLHPCRRRSGSTTACNAAFARPGMLMTALDFLRRHPSVRCRDPRGPLGRALPLHRLSGIVNAVRAAAPILRARS